MTKPNSALNIVLASPFYRGATVSMFLSGLGVSAAAPQIASFLVNELGASLSVAGLYYLTSLTAPIAGYLVGSRSDRSGRRMGLFRFCALAGALGWAGIAFSTQLWMPFVISAIVLAFAGGAGSQIFAAVHDELTAKPTLSNDGVVATIRMALTAGWVIGPVMGTILADAFGYRTMFFVTALFMLAQLAPMGSLVPSPPAGMNPIKGQPGESPTRPSIAAMMPLLTFTGLYILVYAGESIKYGYLPIFMTNDLDLPSSIKGAVIGIQPLIELVLMPIAVIVSRRTGMMNLMAVGAACGIAANLLFATSDSAIGLFAGQIMMGAVWGIFAALGIVVAQRLLPSAVATASAIFMSAPPIASAIGGASGGIGVSLLGLPVVFIVPAAYAAVAVAGLVWMSRGLPERM